MKEKNPSYTDKKIDNSCLIVGDQNWNLENMSATKRFLLRKSIKRNIRQQLERGEYFMLTSDSHSEMKKSGSHSLAALQHFKTSHR